LHQVCDPDQLQPQVQALTERMTELAPAAARMNKSTLRALAREGAAALPSLLPGAYDYADSTEHREGVGAFMDKRPARFS
jgi:1,4-dihydroxy-2-naphthoyl-CoA synthase